KLDAFLLLLLLKTFTVKQAGKMNHRIESPLSASKGDSTSQKTIFKIANTSARHQHNHNFLVSSIKLTKPASFCTFFANRTALKSRT
ncbi:MAG: hypothetical protein SPJ28_04850, partial [Oscillospiraceae bacterium]|nr:hypothetical protein [Oscillospiraceae bacterium]